MVPISIQPLMSGISLMGALLFCRYRHAELGHGREFVSVLAVDALFPGIDLGEGLGMHEALVIVAALVLVGDDIGEDGGGADAPGPFVDAFEVAPLLAVELGE